MDKRVAVAVLLCTILYIGGVDCSTCGVTAPSKAYSLISYNYPQHSIGLYDAYSLVVYIQRGDPEQFEIVRGLASCTSRHPDPLPANCMSFMSKRMPNHYLVAVGRDLRLQKRQVTASFSTAATFVRFPSRFYPGYNAYEPVAQTGHLIRHRGFRLHIDPYHSSTLFRQDSSFLETHIGPPVRLRSYNFPDYTLALKTTTRTELHLLRGNPAHFRIISPGLSGITGSVSFLSLDFMGTFARHAGYVMWLDPAINQDLYRRDATFYPHYGVYFPGYYVYQSVNYPTFIMRHQGLRVRISHNTQSSLMKQDSSFHVEEVERYH